MRRAIVTGAAGMIGSNLCHQLLSEGVTVLGVDDLSGGNRAFLPDRHPRFGFSECDVLSDEFERLVETFNPTVVYHLAAYAAECLSPWIREFNCRNNYQTTTRVVSLAIKHGVEHVVFTSSAAVYGHTAEGLGFEDDSNPGDPYGITKLAGEMDIREAAARFGLSYTIYRPHNVYGRNQNLWDRYRNVAGIFMRQALANEPMTIYGDGSQIRQFTEVGDLVRIMSRSDVATSLKNKTFNIGSTDGTTVAHLAKLISELAGGTEIKYLEARGEAHIVRTDHERLRRAGFTCDTPLGQGLADMWEWAKTAPHWEPKFPDAEHRVGLYSYWNEES